MTGLIPLYAIGVFLSFTLSQAGMARSLAAGGTTRARRGSASGARHSTTIPGGDPRCCLNGAGAVLTAVVTLVFAVTKFRDGAWVILIVIPVIVVAGFYAIRRHYVDIGGRLSLDAYGPPPRVDRHRVILPISGMHRGTVAGLRYARALSADVTAVYVSTDPARRTR